MEGPAAPPAPELAPWALPPTTPCHFVTTPEQLARLEAASASAYACGIDAEWQPSGPANASLLQLALRLAHGDEAVFLLDLLALPAASARQCIRAIFHNAGILKVGFCLGGDVKALAARLGCAAPDLWPRPHIDAATLLKLLRRQNVPGLPEVHGAGLSSLALGALGQPLEKELQRSPWGERPLSPAQLAYAAADAACLLPILDALLAAAPPCLHPLPWNLSRLPVPGQGPAPGQAEAAPREAEAAPGQAEGGQGQRLQPAPGSGPGSREAGDSRGGGAEGSRGPAAGDSRGARERSPANSTPEADRPVASATAHPEAAPGGPGHDREDVSHQCSDEPGAISPAADSASVGAQQPGSPVQQEARPRRKKKPLPLVTPCRWHAQAGPPSTEEAYRCAAEHWAGPAVPTSSGSPGGGPKGPRKPLPHRLHLAVSRAGLGDPADAGPLSFVTDSNLTGLARQLRLCGLDCASMPCLPKAERLATYRGMVELSQGEGRVILTSDAHFAAAQYSDAVYQIRAQGKQEQLKEVLGVFKIDSSQLQLLSRCSACNGEFLPRSFAGEELTALGCPPLEEGVLAHVHKFYVCSQPGCRKVYWQGGQYQRAMARLTGGSPGGEKPRGHVRAVAEAVADLSDPIEGC